MFRVLLVEDHFDYRKAVRARVQAEFPDLDYHEASSGEEAWLKLQKHPLNLIIMDIGLGDVSGLELTKEIKLLYPRTVIALLANRDSLEYREAAWQCGADYFLSKYSVKLSDIKRLIESVTVGRQVSSGARERLKA